MSSLSISKIFIGFSVVSVILISNAAIDACKPYELVDTVCKKQWNKRFCLKVLKSDTRSKFAKSITTLTVIALDVATKSSIATRDHFLRVKTGPPAVLKSLNDCIVPYNTVINSFRSCLKEDDCALTGYDIHMGVDEVARCQSMVDSNGAHDSFITTLNNVTQDFSWLCESLANLMCHERRA